MSIPAQTKYVKRLYKKALQAASDWYPNPLAVRPIAMAIREKFEQNKEIKDPIQLQKIYSEAEETIEGYAHPLPYKYPTAVGGSKYERNMWFEKGFKYDQE
ncbi:NADH dehydrogenase [ubiquinone] 1 beta subcomplex subunit 9 [Zancudomyces culisetae]|uniref:NADH dehydrogenase [ubiquinone] 1 beta subcomplex subunit 9 n=1 Tax=Zancudomyces culisetae TaxID=1213189 RepID=A0A1R1PXX8_ZANCU|nr:NADH dehydrogenase [ubiquinone] 1 beta subcomplex subunit 9 [Zancudomyces culisetae]|eukprot:OMH85821.1 NADH dehydrogenase [ubiquinone] 1 beta subcomplex subunit 9 [Zancudomyces culisetae]